MVLTFFQWCDATRVAVAIRESVWLFPVIETVHLLALALLGGAVLIVDLRLLGLGLRAASTRQLAADAQPWLAGGLAAMIASGIPLFLSEAMRCYESPPFHLKMILLALALLFTFTLRRRVTRRDEPRPWLARMTALVSLTLWTGVGVMGRGIAFW